MDLKTLMGSHPSLSLSEGKVRCSLTGHECKEGDLKGLEQYVKGSKYKKAKQWYSRSFETFLTGENLKHAQEFLVPHKSSEKLLFCSLTRRVLNRIPKKIIAHVVSSRFDRYVKAHRGGFSPGGRPKIVSGDKKGKAGGGMEDGEEGEENEEDEGEEDEEGEEEGMEDEEEGGEDEEAGDVDEAGDEEEEEGEEEEKEDEEVEEEEGEDEEIEEEEKVPAAKTKKAPLVLAPHVLQKQSASEVSGKKRGRDDFDRKRKGKPQAKRGQ